MSRDLVERLRELIEPAIRTAADTGEAQAVDVTALLVGDEPAVEDLAIVQRAIDAGLRGTTLTGYAAAYPSGGGMGLAVVIRGPG